MAVNALNPGFAYILGDLLRGVEEASFSVCVTGESSLQWVLRSGRCPLDEVSNPSREISRAAQAGYRCSRLPRTVNTVDGPREVWVIVPVAMQGIIEIVESLCDAALRIEDLEEYRIQLCDELITSNETLASVYEMGRNPGSFLNYSSAVDQITKRLAMSNPGCSICVWRIEDEEFVPSAWRECEPETSALDAGVLGKCVRSASGLAVNDGTASLGVEVESAFVDAVSLAVVPMKSREDIAGCLAIWSKSNKQFDSRLVGLLSAFAFQTAMAFENDALHRSRLDAERVMSELSIGSTIQRSLLFSKPPVTCPFLEFGAISVPSRHIDGDFFEFMHFGEHIVDVFIGDVMGKGLPAALVGAAMKNEFFRAQALLSATNFTGEPPTPDSILTSMHAELAPELVRLASFVTACYARFDLHTAQLGFVDCGHTKVLHCCADGEAHFLESDYPGRVNLPLGMDPSCVFRTETVTFAPGDVFVFYSDGVTEAQRDGEMFGPERLRGLVEQLHYLEAAQIADAVHAAVSEFTGSTRFRDDLTCVVVKALALGVESSTRPSVLELTAVPGCLKEVREHVEGVLSHVESLRDEEQKRTHIVLALVEACQNIIEHGFPGSLPGSLMIESLVTADEIRFDVIDDGRSFDPEGVSAPNFDGSRDGGFGVYIIKEVMDEYEYSPGCGGRNRLRLTWRQGCGTRSLEGLGTQLDERPGTES